MNPTLHAISADGIIWIKMAMAYLMIGIVLGITMGATENFTLRPVHAHLNLVGWATMALAGVIYTVFPQAGASPLARVHFWLYNLALPIMMVSLALLLLGYTQMIPMLAASEVLLAAGVIAFAANVFMNVKKR